MNANIQDFYPLNHSNTASLRTLREKHDISEAVFLVNYTEHFTATLQRAGLGFRTVHRGNRDAIKHIS